MGQWLSQAVPAGKPRLEVILAGAAMLAGAGLAVVSVPLGVAVFLAGYLGLAAAALPIAFALYIVAAPFPLGGLIHHHKIFIADGMAFLMALTLLWRARARGWRAVADTFWPYPWRWPLIAVLALGVWSLVHSLSHVGTVVKLLEYTEFFVVIVAVAGNTGMNRRAWTGYFAALVAVVAAVAVYGVYQYLFQLGPPSNIVAVHHVRATGFFGQPNVFGAFNEETFPMVVAMLAFGPRTWRRGWLKGAAAVIALGVVVSFSRGAWVADAAAIVSMGIVGFAVRGPEGFGRYIGYGAVLPAAMFGLTLGLDKLNLSHSAVTHSYQSALGRLKSSVTAVLNPAAHFDTNQRLLIWQTAVRAIMSHPVWGVGLGDFRLYIQAHPPAGLAAVPPMAHNFYLEWGADMGIGGILAALWYQGSWIAAGLAAVRRRARMADDFWYALSLGAFGTFVAFIVHNWVDFMVDHGVVVPLLLALGLIVALWRHHTGEAVE